MRNGEPNVYAGLATIRNGYMQMQWSRTQMYLVFNTVALPVAFSPATESIVRFIIAFAGVIVSTCIPLAVARGERWTKYFSQKMAELEDLDKNDGNEIRVRIFSDPTFENIRTSKLASRRIFTAIATLVTLTWAGKLLVEACNLLK